MAIDNFGTYVPYYSVSQRMASSHQVRPAGQIFGFKPKDLRQRWRKHYEVPPPLSISTFTQIQFPEYPTFQVPYAHDIPDLLIGGLSEQPLGFSFFLSIQLIDTSI